MNLKTAVTILNEYQRWLRFESTDKRNLDNVSLALSVVLSKLQSQSFADFLKTNSVKDRDWVNDFSYRQRNEWWLKHWFYIQVKYYILKRKIKKYFVF
jgi:hypothetical protein